MRALVAIYVAVLLMGCGGVSAPAPSPLPPPPSLEFDAGVKGLSVDEKLEAAIESPDFLQGLGLSLTHDAAAIDVNKILKPLSLSLRPMFGNSVAEIRKRAQVLARQSGVKISDPGLLYTLDISKMAETASIPWRSLYKNLKATPGVKAVWPFLKMHPTGMETVPDLTNLQGYLYSAEVSGGLNAPAMWSRGVKGEGVMLIDLENDWNFEHEDYDLDMTNAFAGGDVWPINGVLCQYLERDLQNPTSLRIYQEAGCPSRMDHGTAIMGILGGLHNGHGVDGFAPNAHLTAMVTDSTLGGWPSTVLWSYVDNDERNGEFEPGSVFLTELQHCFSSNVEEDQTGCIPLDPIPGWFTAIQMATAKGVTVITGSNGGINLDEPQNLPSGWHDMRTEDAGSIMVGASMGASREKAPFSICGSRLNNFAWGWGVVTTSYPGRPELEWDPMLQPIPPNDDPNRYYTNKAGGTSAASAMIAGAAVLAQSYAKQQMGPHRYIRPLKLREILGNRTDGLSAQNDGGCNIGVQPRLDKVALRIDTLWQQARVNFPELITSTQLTEARYAQLRDQYGVGLVCKLRAPQQSDASCPEGLIWPPLGECPFGLEAPDSAFYRGCGMAKALDFDGDRKADLVSWSESVDRRTMTWKLDLSSVPVSLSAGSGQTGETNFGAWDVEIPFSRVGDGTVWPVVEDYNSDGRADFAIWDKEQGKWQITFTNNQLLGLSSVRPGSVEGSSSSGPYHPPWPEWNWVITLPYRDQLSRDIWAVKYSRPVPGDYNSDGYIDLALQTSDGYWRIDHGGPNRTDYGRFDEAIKVLTDDQLRQAPGWAYLPAQGSYRSGEINIALKIPDGIRFAGNVFERVSFDDGTIITLVHHDGDLGGNDSIPVTGRYPEMGFSFGSKSKNGSWVVLSPSIIGIDVATPIFNQNIFGGMECHPFLADFDGDNEMDCSVQCPAEFRLVLSTTGAPVYIPLGYKTNEFSLPGKPYFGGISYQDTLNQFELQLRASSAIPVLSVDMVQYP